jgi:hypothetical protein
MVAFFICGAVFIVVGGLLTVVTMGFSSGFLLARSSSGLTVCSADIASGSADERAAAPHRTPLDHMEPASPSPTSLK